jgi:hypothetical protein
VSEDLETIEYSRTYNTFNKEYLKGRGSKRGREPDASARRPDCPALQQRSSGHRHFDAFVISSIFVVSVIKAGVSLPLA